MIITGDQFMLHAIGDYITQSDWMANEKTKRWFPAACHATLYSLPFLALSPSAAAFAVIIATHYLIDRYRLARYVVWAKNWLSPPVWWRKEMGGTWSSSSPQIAMTWQLFTFHTLPTPPEPPIEISTITKMIKRSNLPFSVCSITGYPPDRPAWLAFWLLIISDNILHVCINGAALRWL